MLDQSQASALFSRIGRRAPVRTVARLAPPDVRVQERAAMALAGELVRAWRKLLNTELALGLRLDGPVRGKGSKLVESVDLVGPFLRIAKRISGISVQYLRRQFGVSVKVPGEELHQLRYARECVSLIGGLLDDSALEIEGILARALPSGQRVEDLADIIERRLQVTESRAKLIARDQTLKAYGKFAELSQRAAGAKEYIWSTSRDERVRDEHKALERLQFSWDHPPSVGHPGEDYQCRCSAIPVLPEFEE